MFGNVFQAFTVDTVNDRAPHNVFNLCSVNSSLLMAAVFCNRWSRFNCVLLRPRSSELHVCGLEVMSAWVNSSPTG